MPWQRMTPLRADDCSPPEMTAAREATCNPITTQEYWERSWRLSDVPDPVDPGVDAPENRLHRALHARFVRALGNRCQPGARLIEIGCGGSRWLPYFHRTFGYTISGIDYSTSGIRLSQLILDKAQISATLVHADLFDPPSEMIEQFDVVTSFGVVEHFDQTSRAIAACARYLRPGGTMITEVPTLRGPYGLTYRLFWPDVYRVHVPQSRDGLAKAHADAGLHVTSCEYILGLPLVLTRPSSQTSPLRRFAFGLSDAYSWLERRGLGIPPNGVTSPYALCTATKPARS
jgi:2-polyprenyl-3-methyl-5-hydroxy-6-metoxy-1,4-benzoquinol methylase